MKKQLIIIISLLAGISIIISVVAYLVSFHNVTINLKSTDMAGSIVQYTTGKTPRKLQATSTSQPIKLQDGEYGYSADNTKYDSTPILFKVSGHAATVNIDPAYSRQYLATLLEPELPKINSLITTTYGSHLNGYDVSPGSLYSKGEWYGTTIIGHATPDGNNGDTYHIVLRKVDGNWKIEAKPSLVLTTHNNPTIPKDIMTDLNNL